MLTASDLNSEFNNILSNPASLISPLTAAVDFDGFALTLDGAGVTMLTSTAAVGLSFTTGSKAGTPGTTGSIANLSAHTFTDSATAGSGTATSYTGFSIQRPTLAASNANVVTTDAATLYLPNAPAAGTNETITNAYALWTDDGRVRHDLSSSIVSAAGATLNALNLTAQTATISGSTNITTATGFNFVNIGTPTLSAASALTITNAATLYISDAPTGAGAGPATITNAYALWVDAGAARFDGAVTFNSTASVVDGSFTIIGSADATKKLRFEVDGFTTANTRVITPPDADLTLAAITAKGDIWSASASGVFVKTAVGTAGQVLSADSSASGGVSWAGPGALVTLGSLTASASAQLDFTSSNFSTAFDGTYDEIMFDLVDILAATNAVDFGARISQDGGSTFKAGVADYSQTLHGINDAAGVQAVGATGTRMVLNSNTLSNATGGWNGSVRMHKPSGTALRHAFLVEGYYRNSTSPGMEKVHGGGCYIIDTAAINGVRFLMSSGNIASGTIYIRAKRKT